MSRVVFIEVDPEDKDHIRKRYPTASVIAAALQKGDAPEQCRDADVISCFIHSTFGEEELKQLPHLKLLCTRSVGTDHIDLEECQKRNITVCNVPDYGSHVIAEHVFALLLGTLRHIHEADERVEHGVFDYRGLKGMALEGKTIGVLGTGKIGSRVCRIAHGFGMKILACDMCRAAQLQTDFDVRYIESGELIAKSDIITLHVPATEKTRHMIDADALSSMKNGVIIVNTARGELIDSAALLKALENGKVAYALLDVLEHEKDFEWNKDLIEHPNVVTTPHIAFFADDSMQRIYEDCFESINQFLRGECPAHVVRSLKRVCDQGGYKK